VLSILPTADSYARLRDWRDGGAFAAIEWHPTYSHRGQEYYAAVLGERRSDATFAVMEGEQPLFLIPCSVGQGRLDYWELPIRIFGRDNLDPSLLETATGLAFQHFDYLMDRHQCDKLLIHDEKSVGSLSAVGRRCLDRFHSGALRLNGICDVSQGEPAMRQGLRKSFRSFLNWGRRNLELRCVNRANADRALFQQYRDFHLAVAGRATRPEESWERMFEWVVCGKGELTLGFLATGDLVAGNLMLDGSRFSNYASGVYDRRHFDKPLAHWPLWYSMLSARQRGLEAVDLGDLPLSRALAPKEYNIGYFKRGFATNVTTWIEWRGPGLDE
jgi:hypothetical protein